MGEIIPSPLDLNSGIPDQDGYKYTCMHMHVHMLTDLTCTDEVVNSSLLPLEHVPSLPAA